MRFLEVCYLLPEAREQEIEERLAGLGFANFYVEKQPQLAMVLKVFLGREGEAGVQDLLDQQGLEKTTSLWREELDWLKAWMDTLEPFELAEGVWINPFPDRELDRDGVVLKVFPGTSFGTGLHATTRLAARLLNELDLEQRSVLDVGSGTGILALLAKARGASRLLCLDNDVNAAGKARDTFAANGYEAPEARVSDLLSSLNEEEYYDVIVANIVQEILCALMEDPQWSRLVKGGRPVVFSGISEGKRSAMESALSKNGLRIEKHLQEEGWNAYLVRAS